MNIRKWFVLQILYFKRLFRKPSFIVLLCLVPLLVLGLRIIANEDNGVVSIVLCMEDDDDELAKNTVDELLNGESLIAYSFSEDEDDAVMMLERGECDAVWIFKDDMTELVNRYAAGDTDIVLVRILELEDTTSLRLAREALMASFYDVIAYKEYAIYAESVVPEGTEISEDELRQYYDYFRQDNSLFEYYNIDGTEWVAPTNYLTAPIRGMLALLVLLAGIAGVMYFRQDKEAGVYDYLEPSNEWVYKLSGQLTAMLLVGTVSIISLYISGNAGSFGFELMLMIEYIVGCALFCSLLDRLFGSLLVMGIITPFLVLATFILCPVFFNIAGLGVVRSILPTYYYLMGTHDFNWFLYGLIYLAAALVLNILAEIIFNKGIKKNG